MKIGILALQGAFAEHAKVLEQLGVESVEIRNLDDFQKDQNDLSGLILPGGESTTMGKLLRDQNMLIPHSRSHSIWFTSLWNLCWLDFAG